MKPSLRALLFSIFVFPGAGLWAIGEKRRALIFILPTSVVVLMLIIRIIQIAYPIANQMVETLSINIIELFFHIRSQIYSDPKVHNILWFLLIALITSSISSYFTGKKQEQEKTNPEEEKH